MSELKPCPFCGGKASGMPRFMMGYVGNGVRCDGCGAETPKHLTDGDAAKWWNRRYPAAWCACGDSHTSDSVCVNCLAAESDGAPEIGTQYRDESGAVVAVVAPAAATGGMLEGLTGPMGYTSIPLADAYDAMLAALPEPE